MAKINWTFEALEHLDNIASYHANYSTAYSQVVVDAIFEETDRLAQFPKLGRVVPAFDLEFIREIIYNKYRIV